MKTYLDQARGTKEFSEKPSELKQLINEALFIIENLGIPFEGLTPRRLEKMALSFLAVADVPSLNKWKQAKDMNSNRSMTTRDIIQYINKNFHENISSGSYDDIRRKDLYYLVLSDIVSRSRPNTAMNDSTRGYALNPVYATVVRDFADNDEWIKKVAAAIKDNKTLAERLAAERQLAKIPVKLPQLAKELMFSEGEHNVLQKEIIENFLPRYGYGAEVLYVGDTANKGLHMEKERLKDLNFFELDHGKLPDIVAFSDSKRWLYLIEAVHSSGPISQSRKIELEQLTKDCKAEIIDLSPNKVRV